MTAPIFGMQFDFTNTEAVPVNGADFSKVLVIETSADASASEFPLDTAVRFSSRNTDALTALGSGLLKDQVQGINDQLTGINSAADITAVRVAEGVDTAATAAAIAAIINGMDTIPSAVNATPRIVVAGRTAWRQDLETTNPVIAALQANLGKLLAVAPVDVDDTSSANAIDARESMASERLIPIGVGARVYEGANLVSRPMSPRVAGLMIQVDNANGGKPFDPIANRAINVAGLTRKIPFSLLDGANEGQQMLAANVSIVAEGAAGVDGAIAEGGFYFIGTDNAQTNELFEQFHQVRGIDYITTEFMQITRQFLGAKITADTVEAWLNSISFKLRDHKRDDDILGYTPRSEMFRAESNSVENIRLGHLKVEVGIEPAPSFKRADHEIRRYAPAIDGLVRDIRARANAA